MAIPLTRGFSLQCLAVFHRKVEPIAYEKSVSSQKSLLNRQAWDDDFAHATGQSQSIFVLIPHCVEEQGGRDLAIETPGDQIPLLRSVGDII